MDYSEIHCRLCGVSFNIGRIRTANELRSAAWGPHAGGNDCVGNWETVQQKQSSLTPGREWWNSWRRCQPPGGAEGCQLVRRHFGMGYKDLDIGTAVPPVDGYTEEEDSDYSDHESQGDDERDLKYEFESDDDIIEDLDESFDLMDLDSAVEEHENVRVSSGMQRPAWAAYLLNEHISEQDIAAKGETFLPLDFSPSKEDLELPQRHREDSTLGYVRFEHIASKHCNDNHGYNGSFITVEEMLGCTTVQCLAPKNRNARSDNYFLTGLSDSMPGRNQSRPRMTPVLQWADRVNADDIVRADDSWDQAMPFHPTCFDIYARLSRLHFDHPDINGLMEWYRLDGLYNAVHNFPRNDDVRTGQCGESWNHAPNGEYLAANPLFVPGLAEILQSTIHMEATFSSRAGAFALATDEEPKAQDQFNSLPEEIKLQILSFLTSSDIANLRLASRAYRQLPIFLWRKLLQKEMPWLWEVWDTEEPHPWALVGTAARYKKKQKEIEDREEELKTLQFCREILKEEMPETLESDAWIEAEERLVSKPKLPDTLLAIQAEALENLVWTLPPENTNWYEVYTLVTRHWKYLKGLQNRRRIWTDVGKITSKIRKYRLKGKIKGGKRLGEI